MRGVIPAFERFTERARQVVVLAQEEARELGHHVIGTEHILLGLVRENEGIAARILLDADVDSQAVRNETIRLLSGPRSGSAPSRPTRHQYLVVVEIDEIGEVDAEVERIQAAIKEALDTRPARMPSVKVVHLDPSTRLDTPNRRTHRRG
jgi:ATP-dependent Clp protease ATP-binding subunit ClpA